MGDCVGAGVAPSAVAMAAVVLATPIAARVEVTIQVDFFMVSSPCG